MVSAKYDIAGASQNEARDKSKDNNWFNTSILSTKKVSNPSAEGQRKIISSGALESFFEW